MKKIILLVFGVCLFVSCSNDEEEYVAIPTNLALKIPSNFPEIAYNLEQNPLTEEGVALGKKLFYEGRLSSNGIIACGFCHEQASAFTHHGHTVSHGVDGAIGFRNAQPIQNLAFFSEFTWDGAAIHLDLQPIIPITSEVEMNETIPSILAKLNSYSEYNTLFTNAFGDAEVTSERMLKALSQFMVTMISGDSKYDKVVRNEDNVEFTDSEKNGFEIFKNKCAACHSGALFSDKTYRNNGIPENPRYPEEEGRKRVSGFVEDLYKFRVPSLRNVEKSFPYMHDGRFGTLEDVLNFYTDGITENGGVVDPLLIKADGSLGIDLTTKDKEDLIAFLKTLTDNTFLNDERFAEY
ncbi:cytochrome-c peroxidase [Polaribacter butkevichii]|uniref:Cytochrome-c peroxidase n=1 Tax=Polaribacter butkevichii TaxID=218490 RepID=A0A2P6C7L2_9FLAO|nr:cytochrome c peroxidase [Polaribacter butkevichii]PQJ68913.1 cytochrome-c peroxidase [Polaribacter butkevichii]